MTGDLDASRRLQGDVQGGRAEVCCGNTFGRIGVIRSFGVKEALGNPRKKKQYQQKNKRPEYGV